jgi:hypothetical protein
MSNSAYHTQILLDALRCFAVAGLAAASGWGIGGRLPRTLSWRAWAVIVAPLCTPALLVSYTYASLALHLTGTPWLLTLFYSALVFLKLVPLGVIARRLFPPAISAEARFCEALIPGRSFVARLAFRLHAESPVPWLVAALAFLLAFADFELASLLSIKTWAVQLFDFHAGGLAISESLRRVVIPCAIEGVVIFGLIFLARRGAPLAGSPTVPSFKGGRWTLGAMIAIATVTSLGPIIHVGIQAVRGWRSAGFRETIFEEVMVSLSTACVATVAIWLALALFRRWKSRLALAVPGLTGSLVSSLVILAALNASPPPFLSNPAFVKKWASTFGVIAESPLPLMLVETLLLAPVAILLWVMLSKHHPREGLHLARMAGSRRLIWDLALEPRAAALGLLFLLSYFEFTAASILAPVQMTPALVRLHNLAHYGQTPALSASLFAAVLVPAAVLALTLGGARFYARQNVR